MPTALAADEPAARAAAISGWRDSAAAGGFQLAPGGEVRVQFVPRAEPTHHHRDCPICKAEESAAGVTGGDVVLARASGPVVPLEA